MASHNKSKLRIRALFPPQLLSPKIKDIFCQHHYFKRKRAFLKIYHIIWRKADIKNESLANHRSQLRSKATCDRCDEVVWRYPRWRTGVWFQNAKKLACFTEDVTLLIWLYDMSLWHCCPEDHRMSHLKCSCGGSPGGLVVKQRPDTAGDMGLIPGQGRSHVTWSN